MQSSSHKDYKIIYLGFCYRADHVETFFFPHSFKTELSDCGGMCSLRLPPTFTTFCTNWKRMGILICPVVFTSSAVTMPSSHGSKPISIYLEMDGTTTLFHQRATSLLISCGNWGSSTTLKSVMRWACGLFIFIYFFFFLC